MIEVDQLTKQYGLTTVVDNISFNVKKGEILGFLGPNGAGKSTTMRMLSCFFAPTSGTARICGHDILSDSIRVREKIGYLPESAPSYQNMTVLEFLNFVASIRGFGARERDDKIDSIIQTTSLEKVKYQTIETLSKGFKQRVGFAQALIHDPPVLILDEPTDGLDPNQKREVRALIQKMSKEKAIILSTHILEEMEAVCTRAIIINQGKIVANGSPSELLTQSSLHNVVTAILDTKPDQAIIKTLERLDAVHRVELEKQTADDATYKLNVYPEKNANPLDAVNQLLRQEKVNVSEIYREKGLMDEVFWNLTLGTKD